MGIRKFIMEDNQPSISISNIKLENDDSGYTTFDINIDNKIIKSAITFEESDDKEFLVDMLSINGKKYYLNSNKVHDITNSYWEYSGNFTKRDIVKLLNEKDSITNIETILKNPSNYGNPLS